MPVTKKKILILAANPKDTEKVRLDEEVRGIADGLNRSKKRNKFILEQRLAVRQDDARRAMLDFKPNIVHFCGHGEGDDGIVFEDENGHASLVNAQALSGFFELFADSVECVFLNACYSEIQANAIAQHVNYVIGMKKGIEDTAAIKFAVAFYDALGAGESYEYEFAYKVACNAIEWGKTQGSPMPVLIIKGQSRKKIDCIILCGGYSVRLWPLTTDISKVLLPVAGKPVLEHVLDFVYDSSAIGNTILSVNKKFAPQVEKFMNSYKYKGIRPTIQLVVEPSTDQKDKLGPVGALDYIVSQSAPRDLLILGGDNLFGFQLDDFLHFIAGNTMPCSHNAVYTYQTQDNPTDYGIVDIVNGKIASFQEKPLRPTFKNISTACYFLKQADVEAIQKYILSGGNPDSLGGFIHWLLTKHHSHIGSFLFCGFWFDVGTREILLQANSHYLQDSFDGQTTNVKCLEKVRIDSTANVIDSTLGPNVYIGPGVTVKDSEIQNSIIMEECFIRKSVIKNCVIGSGSIIEAPMSDFVCGPNSKFSR